VKRYFDARVEPQFLVLVNGGEMTRVTGYNFEKLGLTLEKVERDDKSAIDIFRHSSVESGCVAQNFLVVVNGFKEVAFGFLRNQVVDIPKSVNFISEAIVGRNLSSNRFCGFWVSNASEFKEFCVLLSIELLCILINTINVEVTTKRTYWSARFDFIACQIVVSNEA